MKNIELVRQHTRINYLFQKIKSFDDDELNGHWARYLCVISAGILENSLKELLKQYVVRCSNREVANYSSKNLDKIQNPKSSKFIEVLGYFSESWRKDLESFMEDYGRKDAIDSIMNNRHLIVHGKNSGISISVWKEYYDKSIDVVNYIETQIDDI
jgi:hypothetical protein